MIILIMVSGFWLVMCVAWFLMAAEAVDATTKSVGFGLSMFAFMCIMMTWLVFCAIKFLELQGA